MDADGHRFRNANGGNGETQQMISNAEAAETQSMQRDAERNHRWTADGHRFRNANCGNEEMQQMFINAEAAKTRGGAGQETEKRNLTKGNESNGLLSPALSSKGGEGEDPLLPNL